MSDPKENAPNEGNGIENAAPAEGNFDLSEDIKKIQEQADKYKNDYLYLRAEFENYKKIVIRERAELVKYGCERLARDLLNVLDNFERALATPVTPDQVNAFRQGIDMTASELRSVLSQHGINEVPTEGVPFDPAVHEALASEPSNEVEPGNVLRVFKKAYRFHDKLLRPAQVVVAKKPE